MANIETVSWKKLKGNRFSKGIDSAMSSQAGYIAHQNITIAGELKARPYKVLYDQEYLLTYIVRKILQPLSYLGKEKTKEIIDKAWKLYDQENEAA